MKHDVALLLVEDEPNIAEGLLFNLEEEGYRVTHVESGEQALEQLMQKPFNLVILDLALPGIDGLEVCDRLREQGNHIPILMLTARGTEQDRITGLSKGADDYLAKPFNLKEFLLRVAGLLRRANWQPIPPPSTHYTFGNNQINMETDQAITAQGTIQLTELEMKMLRLFFNQEGKVLSRGEILKQVWGMSPKTETRTLDNFIVRLRKYFEVDPTKPRYFLTIRGRGYRFIKNPD
ncbi:response regulator transcription factor [uncultured Desulfuromusa sp.]|uniref:response regulator transcription factor n=1 Tax=uncultured Desulfuromusa sp. TaxID=219183 RepID=UPI002AA8F4A8|nr:response regulator transcription factor [uncultured Desulfuromusa sp.]